MTANKYPATCSRCGLPVAAGRGHIMGKPGEWFVWHQHCVPVVDLERYRKD